MRSISLDQIAPGMYLSQPLLADDGTILLHEGIVMKDRYIEYLKNRGFTTLYVGEPQMSVMETTNDMLYGLKQQQAAIGAACDLVDQFQVGKDISLTKMKGFVTNWIIQLADDPRSMMKLLDIGRKAGYMFSHAVNTAILSIMTGLALGYEEKQLNDLGLAALLHDVGKIKFPPKVAEQFPDRLTPGEQEEYKRHPFYSLEILRENHTVSVDVLNGCFQHHERWNGSGYPMGLKGDSISLYGQIIGIADVYERLIVGMPHRLPTPVYYAAAILNRAAGTYFNPRLTEIFVQNVVVYPIGKKVWLNTQQEGLILGVDIHNKTTPVVRILSQAEPGQSERVFSLDLAKNPGLFIVDFAEESPCYSQLYAEQAYNLQSKIN
ncbi:MAG: HD-GYP domain-containing protein [Sporomusaceae bacterium]|nr:HD-GYP domain-containing protein [Sporomusaceae bacterium]